MHWMGSPDPEADYWHTVFESSDRCIRLTHHSTHVHYIKPTDHSTHVQG